MADILAQLPRLDPLDRAAVQAKLDELKQGSPPASLANLPAVGLWKDRTDLPDDPAAALALQDRLMRGDDGR